MGIMVGVLFAAITLLAAPQAPSSAAQQAPKPAAKAGTRVSSMEFDEGWWPKVSESSGRSSIVAPVELRPDPVLGSTGAASHRKSETLEPIATESTPSPTPLGETTDAQADRAGGMKLDSPLLPVFQFTRSAATFRELGGRKIWWRITVYGQQGEVLGIRELTQVVDCRAASRDRLEYERLGRVLSRIAGAHYAKRQNLPWPSDAERGRHELALFGMQARFPWCFADGASYVVEGESIVDSSGEKLKQVGVRKQPMQASGLFGPMPGQEDQDRFEIVFEPTSGKPRELVHRFAAAAKEGGGARRLLFEDWCDYGGVRIPLKRIYVDQTMRRTTMLEILDIQAESVTERTFRQ